MLEVKGDLWKTPCHWICIPTNGIVKEDDSAVMGKGVALEAVHKFYDLPYILGERIKKFGNNVHHLKDFTRDEYVPQVDPTKFYQFEHVVVSVFSFPTKNHYKDSSDLKLIEKSCDQLQVKYNSIVNLNKVVAEWERKRIPIVCLPRVGCGFGGLNWEKDVKPICEKYFTSDDFVICSL